MIRVRAAYVPVLAAAGRPAVGVGQTDPAPTPMLATVITAVIIASAGAMFLFAN